MKNKNLILGVGVAVLLYIIFKSKKGKQVTEQITEKAKETVKPSSKMVYRGVVKYSANAGINTYLYGFQSLNSITRGKADYSDIFTTSNRLKATQTDNFVLRDSKGNDYTIIGVNNSGVFIKGDKKADFPNGSQFEIRKKV